MQYKTLASAVEAIKNNQCAIKNDDVPSLQRACKYVWPEATEQPVGDSLFYFSAGGKKKEWASSSFKKTPHFIPATEFCRLMDEEVKNECLSDEEIREPIENALYATKRFLTTQATNLAEGIVQYIKEAGFDIVRIENNNAEIKERGITITNVSKKQTSIDLGQVFDENADYHISTGIVMSREVFIEIVTELLTEKNRK